MNNINNNTEIKPISCKLNENVKLCIQMMAWCEKSFNEMKRGLMVPK